MAPPFLEEVVPEETSKTETPPADIAPESEDGLEQEEAKVTGLVCQCKHSEPARDLQS